jgi:hypothetical protein
VYLSGKLNAGNREKNAINANPLQWVSLKKSKEVVEKTSIIRTGVNRGPKMHAEYYRKNTIN